MAFVALPGVPQEGLTDAEFRLFNAVKQNLEQLIGQSGDPAFIALTRGTLNIAAIQTLNASDVSLTGQAINISGAGQAATSDDLVSLATTVQQLVYDVRQIRDTINALAGQIEG